MNWLENMVLQSKLILLAGFMMVALGILGFMSYTNLTQWKDSVNEIGGVLLPSAVAEGDMSISVADITAQQYRVRGLASDPERSRKITDALEKISQAHKQWEAGSKVYTALPMEPGEGDMFDKYMVSYKKWKVLSDELDGIMKTMSSAQDDETFNTAFTKLDLIMDAMAPIRKEMISAMNEIINTDKAAGETGVEATQTESSEDMILSMIVVAVSIFIAALLAFLIIRSITRSITQSVTSIRDGAMQITSASDQVASSSSSLAQGASEQASSV
ncbi:MAG: MCP four helix bundle domain-containing protein, partial [Sulfuricurvum sp.]